MNNQRRKTITKAKELLEQANEILSNVLLEEQDAFDNMPENLQGSMRGEESEEAIENLENALDSLDEACNSLDEIN